jgi:hypothetical protein
VGADYANGSWVRSPLFADASVASSATAINDNQQVTGARGDAAYRVTVGSQSPQPLDAPISVGLAINGAGEVVGTFRPQGQQVSNAAIRWGASGERTVLASDAQARAINDRGQAVGSSPQGRASAALLWEADGRVTVVASRLTTDSYFRDQAYGADVNESGTVLVQMSTEGVFDRLALTWTPSGGLTRLACPNNCSIGIGAGAIGNAIDDAGVVVGGVSAARQNPEFREVYAAAVWDTPAAYTVIGGANSMAHDVNNQGLIVGEADRRPTVWVNRQPRDLLALSCPAGDPSPMCAPGVTGVARGVNEAGQIVGTVSFPSGAPSQAVVWTFVPTPTGTPAAPLVSEASGKCLDVIGGSRTAGTGVVIYPCHGLVNQAFSIPAPGTTGEIRVYGDLCLQPQTGGGANGDAAVTAACTGAAAQRWSRTAAGELRAADGRCLDVLGGLTDDLTTVWTWDCVGGPNQRWISGAGGAAPTMLASRATGKCLDVLGASRAAGTGVVIYPCFGGENQRFALPAVGATGEIRVYGDMCLDAAGGAGQNGDAIVIWPCHGGANQQWTRTAAGEFKGINGRCLDVLGARTEDLTPVWLWDCLGAENQRWDARPQMVAGR